MSLETEQRHHLDIPQVDAQNIAQRHSKTVTCSGSRSQKREAHRHVQETRRARDRHRRRMTRFARGWHCVGLADTFLDGQPHGITVFGTLLVVFADSQGVLNVLDGYCRTWAATCSGHRQGDEIACPFHDWRWGGDGRCKLVPYAKCTPGWPAPAPGPPR